MFSFPQMLWAVFWLKLGELKQHTTKYSKMDQVKFIKGCFPQILLGRFLNILSHV